ncbi:MAG: gliding motility protein GldC [Spirosomaceae bacterium]|jgi:gliding motility-associated protein GldC|nr:gliding motility protein GldC [Spirosomataceae bacterium]
MKKSEINFTVQLDENRVPEKIFWDATENPNEGINETMAINLNIWDQYHKGLLGINLWTKEMPVDEMKHFAVDIIGNLSQMIKDATGDPKIILILEEAGKKITKHIEEEVKSQQQ